MKTVISIQDPVFQAAERYAHKNGLSRSRLFTIAVKEYIEAHAKKDITKELNKVLLEVKKT